LYLQEEKDWTLLIRENPYKEMEYAKMKDSLGRYYAGIDRLIDYGLRLGSRGDFEKRTIAAF
jgi:hypothetical protein